MAGELNGLVNVSAGRRGIDVEPLQAGDGALVERASAMAAAGSDVAIRLTRTTPPPPDEREYDVPVGARSLKVRWTDAGLDATCLVGVAVAGTSRSTRHVRALDLATALWEREPAGRRPRARRRARP